MNFGCVLVTTAFSSSAQMLILSRFAGPSLRRGLSLRSSFGSPPFRKEGEKWGTRQDGLEVGPAKGYFFAPPAGDDQLVSEI